MIDIKINKSEVIRCDTEGELQLIAAELCSAVHMIYNATRKANAETAEAFKAIVKVGIASEDSPTWVKNDAIEGIFMVRRGGRR